MIKLSTGITASEYKEIANAYDKAAREYDEDGEVTFEVQMKFMVKFYSMLKARKK